MIRDMGPDAPTVENDAGGKQSALPYRFDLLDARAMFRVAEIHAYGAQKYGENNWRKIGTRDHVNHAIAHMYAYLLGDRSDDHLGHALCRAMFAVAMEDGE
jgi:hypothetical protein